MPNGNVLIITATVLTQAEAITAGKDPNFFSQPRLYIEQVIEVEPIGTNQGNIVWEWNTKDHLVQDFDNTKANFGDVALTPGQHIELNPDISACENLSITDVDIVDLKIYPNPTSNYINVTSSEPIDKIEFYSILGKKILETKNHNPVDISAFKSGMYFVKIYSGDRSISKKIIKN